MLDCFEYEVMVGLMNILVLITISNGLYSDYGCAEGVLYHLVIFNESIIQSMVLFVWINLPLLTGIFYCGKHNWSSKYATYFD